MKRAIGLIRLSTEEQAEEGRAGELRQEHDIEVAAKAHNLTVIKTLRAIGLSGTKVLGSAIFNELFRLLPTVDGIVVSAVDRLVRPGQLGDLSVFDPFQKLSKRIWTPTQEVDVTTDSGFLTSGILGLMGGLERKLILQRTLDGKEALRKQGKHVEGGDMCLPRGIAYPRPPKPESGPRPPGVWVYEEPDASRIRLAFDLLFDRMSWREIAERIGGGWSGNGIRLTLANPIWKGVRRYKPDGRRMVPLEVPIPLEPLISPERWEAAQLIINEKRTRWRKRLRGDTPFLANGLLYCPCGKPLYVRTDHRPGQHHQYFCSTRYPRGKGCGASSHWQDVVDGTIERMVERAFGEGQVIKPIMAALEQREATSSPLHRNVERDLEKLKARRKRVGDAYEHGHMEEEEYSARLRVIDQSIRELRLMHPAQEETRLDFARLGKALMRDGARFSRRPLVEKRQRLRNMLTEIRVQGGYIGPEITFSGGYLSEFAYTNSSPLSTPSLQIRVPVPDLLIALPEPFSLQ